MTVELDWPEDPVRKEPQQTRFIIEVEISETFLSDRLNHATLERVLNLVSDFLKLHGGHVDDKVRGKWERF